ncbi:hypothetical protein [Paenibacillus sp. FSL R7-269]|uniref:hypothetical protein n=1 Tax=Paenibacillus sp. FSL R7-269 TaxID=1226755 RepID=UPI0005648F40|nr:hypothetical protein [Paenibacillus sp. FSL R7-269]
MMYIVNNLSSEALASYFKSDEWMKAYQLNQSVIFDATLMDVWVVNPDTPEESGRPVLVSLETGGTI